MTDQNLIQHYGYVPFYLFQYVIIGLQIFLIINYKYINKLIDKYIDEYFINYVNNKNLLQQLKRIILSIPLLLIIYYDIRYSSFSLNNLGINSTYNDPINQLLYIAGSYGIIQVLAQDAGIRTPVIQENLVQQHFSFVLISIGMAYSLTKNRSHSYIAIMVYYHLKYLISENIIQED